MLITNGLPEFVRGIAARPRHEPITNEEFGKFIDFAVQKFGVVGFIVWAIQFFDERNMTEKADQFRADMRRIYGHYLKSDHWKEKRQAALKRAEYRCQLCYSPKELQVHHRTYIRLGNEADADLTVLCDTCHSKFHNKQFGI